MIYLFLWLHFIADFVLQSDWMAINKSKNNKALLFHILVYTICLIPFGFSFAMINGLAHAITDYFSSRATSKLWEKQQRHLFFIVIGFDQAIHLSCLFLSWQYLKGSQ